MSTAKENVSAKKSISPAIAVLIIYAARKLQIFAFTFDTALPYIFFILLWGILECRSEITFQDILSRVRSISTFFNIAVVVILHYFYTHYNSKIYAAVWFIWVIAVMFLSEAAAPMKNVSKIFMAGAVFLAALCSLGTSFSLDFSNDGYGWMLAKMFLVAFCWCILFLKSFLVVQMLMERYHYQWTEPEGDKIRKCFMICFLINFLAYMPFFSYNTLAC